MPEYTDDTAGGSDSSSAVLVNAETLYVAWSYGAGDFFKFTGTENQICTIGIEGGDTDGSFELYDLGVNIWSPSSDKEGAPSYNSEEDNGPFLVPYDYDLSEGCRLIFSCPETGEYIMEVYDLGGSD